MTHILAVMALLAIALMALLFAPLPRALALILLSGIAIFATLYGSYWAIRIIHIDRAAAQR